jgi:hypothetical protein
MVTTTEKYVHGLLMLVGLGVYVNVVNMVISSMADRSQSDVIYDQGGKLSISKSYQFRNRPELSSAPAHPIPLSIRRFPLFHATFAPPRVLHLCGCNPMKP